MIAFKMARNLVKLGKYEQAMGWLTKVSEMNADLEFPQLEDLSAWHVRSMS